MAPSQRDDLTLTHRRKEKNVRVNLDNGDTVLFNPSVTTRTSLEDCFRVFTDHPPSNQPALRLNRPMNPQPTLMLYTDGSCMNNGRQNTRSRAGVWHADNHPLNKAIRVPGPDQSNQTGELAGILVALQTAPQTAELTVVTDSQYAIKTLTCSLPDLEDASWANVPNAQWLQAIAYHLRWRGAPTHFKWVKGHRGTRGNEQADRLAAEGTDKQICDEIDLTIPDHFKTSGLRLAAATQATAYKFISGRERPPTPRKVKILLERIRICIETVNEHSLHNRSIWKGCRHQDVRRPIQAFLYKAINRALRIGDFWTNIPTFEQRAHCPSCDHSPESLEHILLECNHLMTERIWTLAKHFWPETSVPWPTLNLGVLLGCGSLTLLPVGDRPPNKGLSRLLRILLSESTHLIWVLRCERVIQGTEHAPSAVETRWRNKIDLRIAIDWHLASFHKEKSFTCDLIYQTWTTALQNFFPDLDLDWVVKDEVLVGINPAIPCDPG